MEAQTLAQILRQIADLVENMDDQQAKSFLRELSRGRKTTDRRGVERSSPLKSSQALREISDGLNRLSSREEGIALLTESELTKTELVAIARINDVYVSKADDLKAIQEKLIESIIGSKLNMRAIRGF